MITKYFLLCIKYFFFISTIVGSFNTENKNVKLVVMRIIKKEYIDSYFLK